MDPWLRRVRALLLSLGLLFAGPVEAQYIFTDTNGDGVCGPDDYLEQETDTLWVWLDTNHDAAGVEVVCASGEPLTISGYEVVVTLWSLGGGVSSPASVGAWINKIPQFTVKWGEDVQAAAYTTVWVGYGSDGATTHLQPGKYLLGGLPIESIVSGGCQQANVRVSEVVNGVTRETYFYSRCPGSLEDNRVVFGVDFVDSCIGGPICSGVRSTSWGWIKDHYH